ncbi:hypothetical protein KSZ_36900 [Dictyobacter formicarum]|uniref:Uncharacterized protein n=1 Tax=Dictyobacter formicarum TaxID=2778368 RepID=A0ABQ3VJ24_9CHLR|nr:hypothetical protein KSZ_36900 [Dictyobacter formicarum]
MFGFTLDANQAMMHKAHPQRRLAREYLIAAPPGAIEAGAAQDDGADTNKAKQAFIGESIQYRDPRERIADNVYCQNN